MENVIKERANKNIFISVMLVIFIPLLVIVLWAFKTDQVSDMLRLVNFSVHPIEIGTDLSQYEGKKVSCSAINISSQVLAIYHNNDPEQKYYTNSYLVTDNYFEHPTLVFFPPSKFDQLEDMYDKTWGNMNGEFNLITPISVKGYVYKLPAGDMHFYVNSMEAVYGEGAADNISEVYFIDDEGAYMKGEKRQDRIALGITLGISELIMLSIMITMIVLAKKYPKVIEKYLLENNMSMFRLDQLFYDTQEVSNNYWISPELTVGYDGTRLLILNNEDISNITVKCKSGKRITYEFTFFSRDNEKCGKLVLVEKDSILQYYENNCPDIVIYG